MLQSRSEPSGSWLTDRYLWLTGGEGPEGPLDTTEVFDVLDNVFYTSGVTLPKKMSGHHVVKVNQTHFILLGGVKLTKKVFLLDM